MCYDLSMESRHLRYFVAVGEELSFTRAAERLHIAQPPLSQQIRQLEEELGVTLLERAARPVRLTEAGLLLLDRARELLAALEATVADTRRIGRGQAGRLMIGFAGSAMYVGLPDIIGAFRDACPDVEVALDEMLAAEIAEALRQRRIDVVSLALRCSRRTDLPSDLLSKSLMSRRSRDATRSPILMISRWRSCQTILSSFIPGGLSQR